MVYFFEQMILNNVEFEFTGCVQGSICKLRTYCFCSCYPGFLLCLFCQDETFGMIPIGAKQNGIRHQKENKATTTIEIIDAKITRHVRKFGQRLPCWRFKDQESNDTTKIIPAKHYITMRSILLHISDNFIYLFGLHLVIIFPKFDRINL